MPFRTDTWPEALRARAVPILFAVTLTWTLLGVSFIIMSSVEVREDLPGMVVGVPNAAVAIVLTWLLRHRWPGFLRLPGSTTLLAFLGRLILSLAGIAVALSVMAGLHTYYFDYVPDSTNPQSGLEVVWAAVLYPIIFTPSLATIMAWYWSVEAERP